MIDSLNEDEIKEKLGNIGIWLNQQDKFLKEPNNGSLLYSVFNLPYSGIKPLNSYNANSTVNELYGYGNDVNYVFFYVPKDKRILRNEKQKIS